MQSGAGVGIESDKMDELIILTRRKGKSIEQHFLAYGKHSPTDGIRYIDQVSFARSLKDLNLRWN